MRSSGGNDSRGISRRRLLYLAGASAAGVMVSRVRPPAAAPSAAPANGMHDHHSGSFGESHSPAEGTVSTTPSPETHVAGVTLLRWSSPATWNGKVPGPGDVAQISRPVLLDVNASVAGVVIEKAGSLVFEPGASRALTSKGNVIVRGKLQMRPVSGAVLHRILITGSSETAFKGGGASPLSTDTGLWVVEQGVFDAAGTAKRAWTRAAGSLAKGATSVALAETPTGWRVGDEVAITPTVSPAAKMTDKAYDYATITSISGKTIKLSKAMGYAHPRVTVAPSKAYGAEVLNLTRNVRVEGRPGHRVHIFLNARRKQTLKYIQARYVGPRKGTVGVLGRYGIHFHMVGDYSRGSLVEGAVVRDAGHHAFVPHASHGVTLRDCISHNTMDAAYWWDPGEGMATMDVLYDRCVASMVTTNASDFRLNAFWLGHGSGNRVRGCVAVGTGGSKNAAGFQWPESPGLTGGDRGDGLGWGFVDCVAHNNRVDGIFVWQNNLGLHVIDRYVGYHNGKAGIDHGAYKNVYQYKNSILYGNGAAGAVVHAVAGQLVPTLSFNNVLIDGAGVSDYLVMSDKHSAPPAKPTQFIGCTLKGAKKAAFGLIESGGAFPDVFDVINCTFAANEFWLANDVDAGTIVRVQDATHGVIALRRKDQLPGTYNPAWNARVTSIAKFA